MKLSFGLFAAIALSGTASVNAIRILSEADAVNVFSGIESAPIDHSPIFPVAKPCSGGKAKGTSIWKWLEAYDGGMFMGPKRDRRPHHHHGDAREDHLHKLNDVDSLFKHSTPHGVHVASPSWMTTIYSFGSPRPSKFIGSDNPDENAIVEAMLMATSEGPAGKEIEGGHMQGGKGMKGWHKKHGHGPHGPGFGRPAGCLKRRIMNALSALRPMEAGVLAFTVGAGIGSLLRIAFMIILLIKRSHSYLNETTPASTSNDAAEEGYPGAAYKAQKIDVQAKMTEMEDAAEGLLPAYSESEGSVAESQDEKAAIRSV